MRNFLVNSFMLQSYLRGTRTKFMAKKLTTLIILFSLAATPVLAFEARGVKIKNNVEHSVNVQDVTAVAIGKNARGGQSIAAIHDGIMIGGKATQSVNANSVIDVAIGAKSTACQQIATIGNEPACIDRVVTMGVVKPREVLGNTW